MSSHLLTSRELAERCRVKESTVRYWRQVGYGPVFFHVGKRALYDEADVEAWLEQQKAAATEPAA